MKVDYPTGAIRWILGIPEKPWFTAYPPSLQPLALTVVGDPPIGQHSLSVSADGRRILLFDNGAGNLVLDNVGDDRAYSKASIYRIDEDAGTAGEEWSYDGDEMLYAPFQSSAYWTRAGDVLILYSTLGDRRPPRFRVVDEACRVLYDAVLADPRSGFAYSAEEICLDCMRVE